jgi:hypothetical protein
VEERLLWHAEDASPEIPPVKSVLAGPGLRVLASLIDGGPGSLQNPMERPSTPPVHGVHPGASHHHAKRFVEKAKS